MGAGAGAGQRRRRMDVDAGALKRRASRLRAAAFERDVAVDLGLALPVDAAVGLQHEVGARAEQLDGAADDQRVVLYVHDEIGVVLQRDHGAGQQEASTALTEQHVRLLHLHLVDHAVVVLIERVDQVAAGTVLDEPAFARRLRRAGLGVIDRETRDELLTCGCGAVHVDLAGVALEARLVEHAGLLFSAQRIERVLLDRQTDSRDRHRDGLVVQFGDNVDDRPRGVGLRLIHHRSERGRALQGIDQLLGHLHASRLVRLLHLGRLGRVDRLDDVVLGDRVLHRLALRRLVRVRPGKGQPDLVAFLVLARQRDPCALARHLHSAPADVLVDIVLALALGEAQPVGLGGAGLVEDQAVPPRVAQFLQHHFLLLQVQVGPQRARGHRVDLVTVDPLLVPLDAGGVVVGVGLALDETVDDLLPRRGISLAIDLPINGRVAEFAQHHFPLRDRQALETGGVSRCRRATPVHRRRVVDPATGSETADPAFRGHSIRFQIPSAVVALVTK